jgi:hypothetical protein
MHRRSSVRFPLRQKRKAQKNKTSERFSPFPVPERPASGHLSCLELLKR